MRGEKAQPAPTKNGRALFRSASGRKKRVHAKAAKRAVFGQKWRKTARLF